MAMFLLMVMMKAKEVCQKVRQKCGGHFLNQKSHYENFNDTVVYLVWGDEPMSHIESWAHIQQRRGKDFPIDRERATLVAQAMCDYLTTQQEKYLHRGVDDGADCGSRE